MMQPSHHPVRLLRTACVTILLVALAAGCGSSPVLATYEGEDRVEEFMQADFVRFFRIHVPERTELGPAAPLVLAFHGVGQNGDMFRTQSGLDQAAASAGFIVVYLEAAMGAWDIFGDMAFLGLDDIAYVREVIDRMERGYVIDRDRIIAVGLSNGGVFAQRVGCVLSHRIAGFIAVAATMPKRLADGCHPTQPVSAFYIAGTVDGFFPVAGNSVLLSVDGTMDVWANANDCSGRRSRVQWPDIADDGTTAYWSRYGSCGDGVRTWLDSIVGGGHAWPDAAVPAPAGFGPTSRDVSANLEIARFLENLPRE
jgi:polyhydroxybutyrate depolymerase